MYLHKGLTISVIDDDPQAAAMLQDFLQQKFAGSEISVYKSGTDALEGIINEPDIIILDYHLDSVADALNSIEVLKKIKDRFEHAPVIFLSNEEHAELAANTIKFGAYDYIVSSVNSFHKVEIVINNILGHAVLKKNLGTQQFFNRLLFILLIVLIIGFFIFRMKSA